MIDKQGQPAAWNSEARISCKLSFKCPRTWAQLSITDTVSIRHCPACDRDVHLALTEEDFRRQAEGGHCVAVRVLETTPSVASDQAEPAFIVGSLGAPYATHLKRV